MVEDVRDIGSIPYAQPRYGEDGIIRVMQRIMTTKIIPMIMRVREEYFVSYEDFTIEQGNTTGYPIPSRAVGMKVRDVALLNQSGLLNLTNLPRLSLEQIGGYYFGQVIPFGFYIQNNRIILWPPNQTTPTNRLRIYYLERRLVLTSTQNCGQIESIAGNVVTLTNVPAAWANGTILNAVDNNPGFDTVAAELEITNIAGNDVTLDTVEDLADGYWIAEEGYSPIAQIPVEAHELLSQATALEILKSLGDTEGYQKLEREYAQMTNDVMNVINPRADANVKKTVQAGNGIADWCGWRWRN